MIMGEHRMRHGKKPRRSLTDEEAIAICVAKGNIMDVAIRFNVSQSTVSQIRGGHLYGDATYECRKASEEQARRRTIGVMAVMRTDHSLPLWDIVVSTGEEAAKHQMLRLLQSRGWSPDEVDDWFLRDLCLVGGQLGKCKLAEFGRLCSAYHAVKLRSIPERRGHRAAH